MKKVIVLLTLIAPAILLAGGGWPKKKGTGYYKLSQWWVIADQHYTSTGAIDPNATRGVYNTSLFAEYGFTDRLTGVLYFPFFSRNVENAQISATNGNVISEGEAINSIGDTNLGVKYGLSQPGSQFVSALSLTFGLPLGESAGGSDGSFQTGDGEFNQLIQLDVSTSFELGSIPSYGTVYGGINNRTEGFSDEFRIGAELGISFNESRLWLIGRLDIVESMKNGTAASQNGGSIFANNTEFSSFTLEGAYYLNEKFGFSAAYAGAFSGEIIYANPSYSIGIFLDIK